MGEEEEKKSANQKNFFSRIRHSTVWKDSTNILLLVFLYTLQGILLGITSVVPLLLQSNKKTVSYRDVGIFSWVYWTFSLKLIWAPFVDTFYFKRIGRRKSWLIPVQLAIGGMFFIIGGFVDRWLGRPVGDAWGPLGTTGDVQIFALTAAFFSLNFLAATQDIAVDGWAISMLSKRNLGWAPTCQTTGQSIGILVGSTLFMVFESPDMCNDHFRSTPIPGKGFISFSGFLYACGVLFTISTIPVGLFKKEIENSNHETSSQVVDVTVNENDGNEEASRDPVGSEELELPSNKENEVLEEKNENQTTMSRCKFFSRAYITMIRMLMLKPVLVYVAFILARNFILIASDSASGLKLIERGLSKEQVSLISMFMIPYDIVLPLLVVRCSSGPRPISTMLKFSIPLFFLSFTSIPLVYYVDYFKTETSINSTIVNGNSSSIIQGTRVTISPYFYAIIAMLTAISSVFESIVYLSQGTFHARIADPLLGGTYMTLLNTLANLCKCY
ncbi:unnamed protein product [Rodentolepis nana]|uniref:Acetyl-coenzyme A transporter 1 n=1 Tax=Rodentolepis nana TaxID=102285 RepID=A0A0R3TD99_RODNA|nr:unnamed protein product [Rodentolepis nana]